MSAALPPPTIYTIAARDGVKLAVAVYRPEGDGPFPALLAASPYRFDNDAQPAIPAFMYRETGPIGFYVREGYAYVRMDVRGTGRSGGEFEFLSAAEQRDLYDVVEWIGAQAWCTGKVGGIGQSYFCMAQWFMGLARPPSLACLGTHDGMTDPYRTSVYSGGILGSFFPTTWFDLVRTINAEPATPGALARDLRVDLNQMMRDHPMYDDWWQVRTARERLGEIEVPVYASGVWSKDHRQGALDGFRDVSGPVKLRLSRAENAPAAQMEYASEEFHRRVMLPFYDHWLKGAATDWAARPAVEYEIRESDETGTADTWPPAQTRYRDLFLSPARARAVVSINDGSLGSEAPRDEAVVRYRYPDPDWVLGNVGFGEKGPGSGFDAVRRVLTFSTAPLERDLLVVGPIALVLHLSSSGPDTDVFVRLVDQPGEEQARAPDGKVMGSGWLRASHRELDPAALPQEPRHRHEKREPLVPGEPVRLDIALGATAWRVVAGHRLRLEVANTDSPLTVPVNAHLYPPRAIGEDQVHLGGMRASRLSVPVLDDSA